MQTAAIKTFIRCTLMDETTAAHYCSRHASAYDAANEFRSHKAMSLTDACMLGVDAKVSGNVVNPFASWMAQANAWGYGFAQA